MTASPKQQSSASKILRVTRGEGLDALRSTIEQAAFVARSRLADLGSETSPLSALAQLKFFKAGVDPLKPSAPLNFVEQLNQSFTYLATLGAVEYLFGAHLEVQSLELNLGTAPGTDIWSLDAGGVAAEVFAATSRHSNGKLRKDVRKVAAVDARWRYVFFMSPEQKLPGLICEQDGVKVYSLGFDLCEPRWEVNDGDPDV